MQANVRNYYMQFEETQTQDEIDIKIKEFEERSRGAFAAQVFNLGTRDCPLFKSLCIYSTGQHSCKWKCMSCHSSGCQENLPVLGLSLLPSMLNVFNLTIPELQT